MLHITDVRTSSGHTIWLRFSDGAEGFVDLARELGGAVVAPEYLRAVVGPPAKVA